MTTRRRFLRWRRIAGAAQAVVALGLPFVSVGGESALRLDVPAGRLHAFGASFAIDEAFVVLAATLLVTVTLLLTVRAARERTPIAYAWAGALIRRNIRMRLWRSWNTIFLTIWCKARRFIRPMKCRLLPPQNPDFMQTTVPT